jgi:MSHA biogenesis protein MshL
MRISCTVGLIISALIVVGCAREPVRTSGVSSEILDEMGKNAQRAKPRESDAVNEALLPPLRMELPQAQGRPIESRFDLNINNAPAREVFMSIVSGTRYSMLIHSEVSGTISVNLKDSTIPEALEAIREVYGYEYKIDGTRIYIQPAGLQTRVFQVNYLVGARQGRSDMRVSGVSTTVTPGATNVNTSSMNTTPITTPVAAAPAAGILAGPPSLTPGSAGGALGGGSTDATRLATVTLSDLWQEIMYSLRAIVGISTATDPDGRSVIISPQSGVVVVRALPHQLRSVEKYLKAMKLSVDRQVMIEAKIVDVTLSQAYQAGVNWAFFPRTPAATTGGVGGFVNNTLSPTGAVSNSNFTGDVAGKTVGAMGAGLAAGSSGGGVFGLAIQVKNFAAVLNFLESQGTAQVLSSPRIAVINNQKAVLKVGSDELFVVNISPPTITPGGTGGPIVTPSSPILDTRFSGISLDITPQIDDVGNITLHIHPLVSQITEKNLLIDFGTGTGPRSFSVASAEINESDTIVRAQDGNIVVLGGLMKVLLQDNRGGVPGLADAPGVGGLFRNTSKTTIKKELIILLKASIIHDEKNWEQEIQESSSRMRRMGDDWRMSPNDQKQ